MAQTAIMYENLWLLYNKTAFDECDSSLDPGSRLLLHCNTPTYLAYFPIIFAEFGADPDGLRFQGGRTYYLIGKLNVALEQQKSQKTRLVLPCLTSPLITTLYYLNAWNRLGEDRESGGNRAFGKTFK